MRNYVLEGLVLKRLGVNKIVACHDEDWYAVRYFLKSAPKKPRLA